MLGLFRKCVGCGALVTLVGCGGSEDAFTASDTPEDVSGSYTVALTNRASSCDFPDWMEGKQASGIGLVITQDGANLQATVDGITAIFLNLALGSAEFEGSVHRKQLTLTNYGTRNQTSGNCTFTYNATVEGALDGDAIAGTITYAPATNDNPDCSEIECEAVQEFSGSRPPQ